MASKHSYDYGSVAFFLRRKTKNIKTIKDYQQFFESIVQDVVNKTIDNFSIEGIDNLEIGKGYLFLSNYRDITLDSALLNLIYIREALILLTMLLAIICS